MNCLSESTIEIAFEVKVSPDNFSLRKHNLVPAMLAVNDLFYPASSTIASLFHEDVTAWLDLANIRYAPSVKFTGKSVYDCRLDFIISKAKAQPKCVLRAINCPNRDAAQVLAFGWIDTREVHSPDSRAYPIVNDSENKDI